jgi:hypothetical protein
MAYIIMEGANKTGECEFCKEHGGRVHTLPEVLEPVDDLADADLDWDSYDEFEQARDLKPGETWTSADGWRKVERTA